MVFRHCTLYEIKNMLINFFNMPVYVISKLKKLLAHMII